MRFQAIKSVARVCLCAAIALTACSGGASSALGIGIPTISSGSIHGIPSHARRLSLPTCTGKGLSSFVGGDDSNVAGAAVSAVLGGAFNQACDVGSGIGAGTSNVVSSGNNGAELSFIGSGSGNAIDAAASFIGSGVENSLAGAAASFIGGGYENNIVGGTFTNAGAYSVIAGGENNTIQALGAYGGFDAFIGAGQSNVNEGEYGVLDGGLNNTVSGSWGTIDGGLNNTVSGSDGTVGGGSGNQATGSYATVPGGIGDVASGEFSFAAGDNANAAHAGSFVWSDDVGGTQVATTAPNQFIARATGGVTFYTNPSNTMGATLMPGSGTWASVSDRALKTNVASIDEARILAKIASLPISEWSYTSEQRVRHVGPMAQDFYAAFGVREDNRHITSIDENGVALAAIKALNAKNARLEGEVEKLQRQVAKLATMVSLTKR